jgi:glycosyltransferase involved in cell wall biosynthesis
MILNEALSLGKPIVSTTSVAAAYDLIWNDKNGYQVAADDPEALLRVLKNMTAQPTQLKQVGEFSRAYFDARFQYPCMYEGFRTAITAVCEKHS